MVMEVVPEEDVGVCGSHPYRNNATAGGICAFCLQEKLGTLVSSSFRSEVSGGGCSSGDLNTNHHAPRPRFPFVSGLKKRNKQVVGALDSSAARRRSEQEESSSHHRRGFWSFLYVSKHSSAGGPSPQRTVAYSCSCVSRSKSLGCGSKRFSGGDFFERLSNGFSRVESHDGNGAKDSRVRCSRIFGGSSKRWSQ